MIADFGQVWPLIAGGPSGGPLTGRQTAGGPIIEKNINSFGWQHTPTFDQFRSLSAGGPPGGPPN